MMILLGGEKNGTGVSDKIKDYRAGMLERGRMRLPTRSRSSSPGMLAISQMRYCAGLDRLDRLLLDDGEVARARWESETLPLKASLR